MELQASIAAVSMSVRSGVGGANKRVKTPGAMTRCARPSPRLACWLTWLPGSVCAPLICRLASGNWGACAPDGQQAEVQDRSRTCTGQAGRAPLHLLQRLLQALPLGVRHERVRVRTLRGSATQLGSTIRCCAAPVTAVHEACHAAQRWCPRDGRRLQAMCSCFE